MPSGRIDELEQALGSGRDRRRADRGDARRPARPGRSSSRSSTRAARSPSSPGAAPSPRLRTASTLEATYFEAAGELAEMIRRGEFPLPGSRSDLADSLRVGDGFVRTNAAGTVLVRQPQRDVGLPAARPCRRPRRYAARARHVGPGRPPADRPRSPRHPARRRQHRGGDRERRRITCCCGSSRCARTATAAAR